MVVCVPVTSEGLIAGSWGRAGRVAVATVSEQGIEDWQEFAVGWDALHDSGTEGSHHARIARFLLDHDVEVVVAEHMGPGMQHMLGKMGLEVRLGQLGPAQETALAALRRRDSA